MLHLHEFYHRPGRIWAATGQQWPDVLVLGLVVVVKDRRDHIQMLGNNVRTVAAPGGSCPDDAWGQCKLAAQHCVHHLHLAGVETFVATAHRYLLLNRRQRVFS
jgi:hypothetical protein